MTEPDPQPDPRRLVQAEALRDLVTRLFASQGLTAEDAATVADCLVTANLRGTDTHGVFRVPTYLKRLRAGIVTARPAIRVERVAHSAVHLDGDNGMGAVVGSRAVAEATALARETGIGLVSVFRSTHYGAAAYLALKALAEDLVAMIFTNASPALPPWGGRAPFFGTSPLAVAVPSGREHPFLLDMAMSVLARGNVYVAAQAGTPIPEGLALDAAGRPTRDPRALIEGGTMLPFGGVKGAALSMLMDIFGGVLSGAAFAGRVGNPHSDFDRPQDVGHLILCFRPDLFMPMAAFKARMDELVARTKAQPLAEGFDAVLMPGERESLCAARRSAEGIPLSAEILAALNVEAARRGIPGL